MAVTRQQFLRSGFVVGTVGSSCSFLNPDPASAARGAAELDFEYYMRDLIGGNKKEGNVLPSQQPNLPPSRTISNPLRSLLLNDNCSGECLTTALLVESVAKSSGKDPSIIENDIMERANGYRERASKSFYARAPWLEKSVSDQYYFDLTSYALWRTAADVIPNYTERDRFVRKLGRSIYEKCVASEIIKQKPPSTCSVVESISCMEEILSTFESSGFCRGFRLGEKLKKGEDPRPIFDEFDDEAVSSGAGADCLVSIFEPATLAASLQITGEQSRFSPDYVGPTLAAMWEKAGIKSSWETFFVDSVYRPNPKDYFPDEQLLQYTLIAQE